ncbi:hypothetical protein [Pedobacter miscanthi]|uniref:hypothetical protein n=1 Tax=Pedobacter miscanthi TaxID=2259170 RepID=UPI00292CE3D7|nr:hypothetical protein [Pedobacter miscanthi]
MNTETTIPTTIKAFGNDYVFQAVIDDATDMENTKENWRKAGHFTMVKKGNRLYASQERLRGY